MISLSSQSDATDSRSLSTSVRDYPGDGVTPRAARNNVCSPDS